MTNRKFAFAPLSAMLGTDRGPAGRYGNRTRLGLLCIWAMVGAATNSLADNGVGGWQSPSGNNWPLIPIHATLTPDGRVLTYATKGGSGGILQYDVWDPASGLVGGHITLPNQTRTNIFCGAQLVLPHSGSVFLAGGKLMKASPPDTGTNYTNLFDYTNNTLTRGNDLNRPRYYSTTTMLLNGEVYIQGGYGGADFPEVRDTSGNFRLLTGAPTGTYGWFYPRNFVAPDGRIFGFDDRGVMYYTVTAGTGSLAVAGKISATPVLYRTTSAVMYRPGKILKFGGASNGALTIDLTAMTPTVSATGTLSTARQWVNGTVLADGRVLATGGSTVPNQLIGVNNAAEIWDPSTGTWTVGASGAIPRLYHSFALLLPDASVLVGGGGAPGPLTNLNAEIYYPPYLYTSAGVIAARPTIDAAPDSLDIGQSFTMSVTAPAVSRVTLVKTGAVTHSFNMDQRFLELLFTVNTDGTLSVLAPQRASDATPGYYLLFVIDGNGVPSVGKIVAVNIQVDTQAPSQPTILGLTISNGKPTLSWGPSTDDIGVAGYIIYRSTNGTLGPEVTRTLGTPWTDLAALTGNNYTYAIAAYDVAGNVSLPSSLASVAL